MRKRMLAASYDDGWAFVQSDDVIFLVRPPYSGQPAIRVDESTVQAAVASHGFEEVEQEFGSWGAVFDYLNEQAREARGNVEADKEHSDLGEALLRSASDDTISAFLDKVEFHLIPDGDWLRAENVLNFLLSAERVHAKRALWKRAVALRTGLDDRRRKRHDTMIGGIALPELAPYAVSEYGEEKIRGDAIAVARRQVTFA